MAPFYGPKMNSKYLTKKPTTKMSTFFLLFQCTLIYFLKTITKLSRNYLLEMNDNLGL